MVHEVMAMAGVVLPDEVDEQQEVDYIPSSALAILNQSEHAAMVQTANLGSNRRKLSEFESKLFSYANHSQPVALSMFYSLPRAGKQIIGPSVRFAEVVAPCWRNCAVASRMIGDTASTVTAQGIFIDYEANLRNSIEVPRRITDKQGNRYNDDMIITTSNAAMSIARRNAVLKGGVPQALWQPAYEAAQLTAVGKAESHAQRVANAMEYLYKLGVTDWQILNAVGVASTKELETEHLLTLRVLCQEIKQREKTVEQVFGSPYDKEITALFLQLKLNDAQQTMLRNSYMGRAEALVNYLRERVGAARPAAPPPEQRAERAPTEPPPAPAESPLTVEETVAQKSTPAWNERNPISAAPPDDKRDSPAVPDDSVRPAAAPVGPAFDPSKTVWPPPTRQQTSMEPPPRRRGRPTREEAARQAAAAQGSLIPDEGDAQEVDSAGADTSFEL
jgi:hypothetical protein